MLVRRVPTIFGGNTLYATSAVVASLVMVMMHAVGQSSWGMIATTVTGAGLTLAARGKGWILPESYARRPRYTLRPRAPWRRLARLTNGENHSQ